MKTYVIEYGVYFSKDKYESHETKVKQCMSEAHAQVKLEKYLKNKYPSFQRMVVYKVKDDWMGVFGDMLVMNFKR
jgi:hypothetical protein